MTLLDSLKYWWRLYWHQESVAVPEQWKRIDGLLATDVAGCVKRAMEKMQNEPVYPGRPRLQDSGSGPVKRKEVTEWAIRYAKDLGHEEVDMWRLNFVLEYLVGVAKKEI